MDRKPKDGGMIRKVMLVLMLVGLCNISPLLIFDGYAQSGSVDDAETFWLWQFLGRLHPLAVHFPVGLLLFAAVLELFTLKNFHSKYRPGINLLVFVGAIAAVLAAVLGLVLANNEDYGGSTLDLHQWTGIATAILGAIAFVLLLRVKPGSKAIQVKLYRGVIFFTAIGVSVAGHFGASLTHGDEYLSSVLPWNADQGRNLAALDFAAFASDSSGLSDEQQIKLLGEVRTIIAHSCYSCHSEEKVKGDLRLDGREFIFAGGESGHIIQPGVSSKSELVRRISLPKSHDDVMPSKGKLLSEKEIAIISLRTCKANP